MAGATTPILPSAEEVPDLVPRPGSVTWRIAGDARLMAGSGYALLLQVAHPVVGAGVAQHSDFRRDPWGRLWRTLDYVNLTLFGGPDAAAEIGRRTRAMHQQIKGFKPDGERYHALDPEAFAWVHATLAHAILRAHERFGDRPAAWEREVFYAEWRRVGRLIGVRERDLPVGLGAFERYVERMVDDVLVDTRSVHDVLETLAAPARPPVPGLSDPAWKVLRVPAAHTGRLITHGMLGPRLRERFGLSWSRGEQLRFDAVAAVSRASGAVLPRSLKAFGPTYLAWRRDAIRATGIPL